MGDDKKLVIAAEDLPVGHVDLETRRLIQEAGLDKPPSVTMGSWKQNAEINPKLRAIAYLAAQGISQKEIAETMGMDPPNVCNIINSERMQFEIRALGYRLFGKDIQSRFREILPKAIDCAEEIMTNPKSRPGHKLSAAINFMDRALGKPKQSVEVEGSLIKALFDRLDGKDKVVEETPFLEQVTKQEMVREVSVEPEKDSIDKWVDENV